MRKALIGCATGIGVGVNALLSKSLGEGNQDRANRTAGNGVTLAVMATVLVMLFGIFGSRSYFDMMSDSALTIDFGAKYISICCLFSLGIFIEVLGERLLQSSGRTMYTMVTQGVGAVVNIILDPVLIFGLGPFPKMGIAGAAVATVFAQIVGALLGLVFNLKANTDVKLKLKGFRFRGSILREIYTVGVPSMLMMSIGSLMDVGMNKILISVSDTAVSVFGVYYKLQSFVFMPVFGISQGMVPIVGYNYGARRVPRMKQVVRLALFSAFVVMGLGTLLFQLCPRVLLSWFSATEEMYSIGVPALRICSLGFLLSAACIMLGDTLMGMGIGYVSAVNSFLRQIVILLPLAYVLERIWGVESVWYAFVASECMSLTYSTIMFVKLWREKVRPLEAGV